MTRSYSHQTWILWLAIPIVIGEVMTYATDCAFAQQIKPDDTLGGESSVVEPPAPRSSVEVILGGARRGDNLFHSFAQFSVLSGHEAHFNNAPDIQNIISRVTGGSSSSIDGLLRANGAANLFLINPNGIIFGNNASLRIGGSFIASTATSLNLADGTQFSATAPSAPSLLEINVPVGLQFNKLPESIVVRARAVNSRGIATGLRVESGKMLAFLGGGITIERGILVAPEGRVELGGIAENSHVSLKPANKGWEIGYADVQNFRDIQLIQSSIGTSGQGGGDIQLQGRRVTLTNGSTIFATVVGAGSEPGRSLKITATDSVELSGSSLITSTLGAGRAGDIIINTETLFMQDKAAILTQSASIKDATGRPIIQAEGRAGDLIVTAPKSVEISNQSEVTTSTQGPGDAGDLRIETGQLVVQDRSEISSVASVGTTGNGGNLTLKTRQLNVRDGSTVTVSSFGTGRAGNLIIDPDLVQLDRGTLAAETVSGKGGNITIWSGSTQLRNNSLISATAQGSANGGNISIDSDTLAVLENSTIRADAVGGTGGSVRIRTQGLFVSPDSGITATSKQGPQFDGVVEINTPDVDPSQGLVTLPTQPVDVSGLIAQSCPAGEGRLANQFVVTGRGGLPDNPSQMLSNDTVWSDLRSPTRLALYRPSSESVKQPTNPITEQLVEAQGWVVNNKGEVVLTAAASSTTPHDSWMTPAGCHAP